MKGIILNILKLMLKDYFLIVKNIEKENFMAIYMMHMGDVQKKELQIYIMPKNSKNGGLMFLLCVKNQIIYQILNIKFIKN